MEGWNDPPKFVPPPTGNLKINLNKRVAFPLSKPPSSSNTDKSSDCMPPSLPPSIPSAPSLPLSSESISKLTIQQSLLDDESFDSQVECEKVFEIFDRILTTQSESAVQASVKSKLKSLNDEWNLYDKSLLKLIVELAAYIDANDLKNASRVQRKIIMSGCNKQWMHGIRQLISIMESNVNDTSEDHDSKVTE